MILELSGLEHLDSTAVGVLVGGLKEFEAQGRRFYLVNPRERIRPSSDHAPRLGLPVFPSIDGALAVANLARRKRRVSTETAAAICECTNEPPHRFAIATRSREREASSSAFSAWTSPIRGGKSSSPTRELKMGYDNVYKACFVCVDRGHRETAIVLPISDVELGLPPA